MDQKQIERLKQMDAEIMQLEHISALLQWDEEIQMPSKELEGRSDQISLIQGMIYDRKTSTEMGEVLDALDPHKSQFSKELTDAQKALIRLSFRDYERQEHIPKQLITELSKVQSRGQAAWARARETASFVEFQPHLERIVNLKREWADAVGYGEHPYDPLIDEYEPGMTTADVEGVFEPLAASLVRLMDSLPDGSRIDDSFLYLDYPKDLQDQFGRMILKDMGVDFSRFVMTESVHPFTTTVGANDVRISTRYSEPSVSSPLFSTIHEGGHALYELGSSNALTQGSIISQGTSLSVHESQSRLWENIIGRSPEFWYHYYPLMRQMFPEQLGGVDAESFIRAVNKVEPSMIRVNADEVTYSLHIILRFRLEKELAGGELSVKHLPEAWNEQMKSLLNICPENDAQGVLQDIHWSAGLLGYFPTYALGNLFAAQFFNKLTSDHPDAHEWVAAGKFTPVLSWLKERIYRHGSIYTAKELLQQVTGEQLNAAYFSEYLNKKYTGLFCSS